MAALNSVQADIQNQANYLDFYAAIKGYDIQKQAEDLGAQYKNLQTELQAQQDKIKSAGTELQEAQNWNTAISIGVGVLAGVACTVATAGVGAIACAAGAGAIVAGLSNLNSQYINTGDVTKTNVQELAVNIAVGGALGAVGELGGLALGAGLKAIANTGAGKVITSGISGLTSKGIGGIDNVLLGGVKQLDNIGNNLNSVVNKVIPKPAYAGNYIDEAVEGAGFQNAYAAAKSQVVASIGNQGTSGGARAGKAFTQKGKKQIDQTNISKYGELTCEGCGQQAVPALQSKKGVTPPMNQAERDHIIARSFNGDGSPSNGQILCKTCNLEKSNKQNFTFNPAKLNE